MSSNLFYHNGIQLKTHCNLRTRPHDKLLIPKTADVILLSVCYINHVTTNLLTFYFTVHGGTLNDVHQFTYLGSALTSDCDLNNEIQQRVKLSSAAFGRLCHRVFLNRNLAIATKIALYKVSCISILLCGCESWAYQDSGGLS